jgi:NADH-quinone oxidoreductase subunit M
MAMLGAFQTSYAGAFGLSWVIPVIAGLGVVLSAVYLLWMFQKVFYGPVTNHAISRLRDLKHWEVALVGVFLIFIFWGGIYPNTFLRPMEASLSAARMMATARDGQRPQWNDPTMEVDDTGALVRVAPRADVSHYVTISPITPAYYLAVAAEPARENEPLKGRGEREREREEKGGKTTLR